MKSTQGNQGAVNLHALNAGYSIRYIIALGSVEKSRDIPCCESGRPGSIVLIPDEVVVIVVSRILYLHGVVKEALGSYCAKDYGQTFFVCFSSNLAKRQVLGLTG
jgi:hypothetical protein